MSISPRYALITGSSRGIGRGIALRLAEQGTRVAIHYYQNEAAAQETLNKVRELGSDGVVVQADVTQPEAIRALFRRVHEELGGLDIFVSNARPEIPAFYRAPLDITLDQWNAALSSQATAFLVGAQVAARQMRDGGRIIAVTYATGSRTGGWQDWVAMGSAKAALESAVRYFAVALARRGITVNAISPCFVEDSVLNTLPAEVQDVVRRWHERGWTPMGRLGTPADMGNAVRLLCSEDAGFITGQTIHVDGGASLMNAEVPTEIQLG